MAYILAYPRSGKSWFLYCLNFVIGTKKTSEILYFSHYAVPHEGHEELDIINNFDIKNILLLRNYKECIFSQSANIFQDNLIDSVVQQSVDSVVGELASALSSNGCGHPYFHNFRMKSFLNMLRDTNGPENKLKLDKLSVEGAFYKFYKLTGTHKVDDFLLEGFPIFKPQISPDFSKVRWNFVSDTGANSKNTFELALSSSPVFHFYFALQLQRYYDLLNYHDKVLKTNPNNALLIRYEDFMQNPFLELSKVINFLERTTLIFSNQAHSYRNNLLELVNNLEHHREISIGRYKKAGHMAASYGSSFGVSFYLEDCSKEFIMKIDNVLEKKNPELFNKYLLCHKEKNKKSLPNVT